MQKSISILTPILLIFSFLFLCVGYAAVSDGLAFSGVVSVDPVVVVDYLHVSVASLINPSSSDRVVNTSGSTDASSPMGTAILYLDFTDSLTKTVNLTVTNSNPTLKYSFYEPRCVSAYNDVTAAFSASVNSGITGGTLNSLGLVVDGTTIVSAQSISNISITVTSTEAVATTVVLQMIFGFEGEADKEEAESQATIKSALDKLSDALNNESTYDRILSEMSQNGWWQGDYVGNVVGSGTSDTQLIEDIFGDTLTKVSFTEGGTTHKCTVMIKRKNVTSVSPYSEDEMVLYMTTVDLDSDTIKNGSSIPVYAIVFVKDTTVADSEKQWIQYGDIYLGNASVNGYNWPHTGKDSFDTESWRSEGTQSFTFIYSGIEKKYTVSDGTTIANAIKAFEGAS